MEIKIRGLYNPLTSQVFMEGDFVRKYRYTKEGYRSGLSKPYELVFYNEPLNRFFLKEAAHMDYLDVSDVSDQSWELVEDCPHYFLKDEDCIDLVKISSSKWKVE